MKNKWQRIRGGVFGIWQHSSGWVIRHCGHPTALWPYFAILPGGGEMLLSGGFGLGYGFRTVALAKAGVEAQLRKDGKLVSLIDEDE